MNNLIKILAMSSLAFTFAFALGLSGCGKSSNPTHDDNHSVDDGHGHGDEGHDGHDHAEGESNEQENDHDEMLSLGTVTFAGTTLAVSTSNGIDPLSRVDLDIEVISGEIPSAVRFWIGDEAGTDALKIKADGHGDHFHGQAETPERLAGASLWFEVEAVNGERILQSLPLQ